MAKAGRPVRNGSQAERAGGALRSIRKGAGLSLKTAAAVFGRSPATFSRWENGKRLTPPGVIEQFKAHCAGLARKAGLRPPTRDVPSPTADPRLVTYRLATEEAERRSPALAPFIAAAAREREPEFFESLVQLLQHRGMAFAGWTAQRGDGQKLSTYLTDLAVYAKGFEHTTIGVALAPVADTLSGCLEVGLRRTDVEYLSRDLVLKG